MTIHAETKTYQTSSQQKWIEKGIIKWLADFGSEIKVINVTIVESTTDYHKVKVTALWDRDNMLCEEVTILASPFLDEVWIKYMSNIISEGICYIHGKLSIILQDNLRKNLEELAINTSIDFHPNSNDIVRDFVHPALYPFIKVVSKLKDRPQDLSSSSNYNCRKEGFLGKTI